MTVTKEQIESHGLKTEEYKKEKNNNAVDCDAKLELIPIVPVQTTATRLPDS